MLPTDRLSQLRTRLWQEREALPRFQATLIRSAQYAFALARDLFEGQLSMRAMSLVYTTLLSLVPLLALSFSVLKALGVQNQLEPTLHQFLAPLGPQGAEITDKLIGFVEKTQVGVLGSLGVALLFYTAVSMIQKVESSFNFVWRIERIRPIGQRISEYLSVLMVGPIVVFSALGITGAVLKSSVMAEVGGIAPLGFLITGAAKLVPYLMIMGMFTFLYIFVPNTKVRLRAAAIGGIAAGIMWQTASLAFASFVAGATNYNAIYSSFAIIIFLLIWLYVGWLILLIGCQLAFYVQHPMHMKPKPKSPLPSGRQSEYIALMIMGTAGQRYVDGKPGLTEEEFSEVLQIETEQVTRVMQLLIDRRFLVESGPDRLQLIPARDLQSVKVSELWQAIRSSDEPLSQRLPMGQRTLALLDAAEDRFMREVGNLSVREWLLEASTQGPQ